jgi:GH25 family lysozyme M1 (1,4-beta-N-acetylmuramidase)
MTELARGQDVSGLYQDPRQMRYQEWRGLGFCYGFYEVAIGLRRIQYAAEHRAGMRAAGYLTAPYQALHESYSPADQCRLLLDLGAYDDELPFMLDVERAWLAEPMLRAWCDYYDAHTGRELVIYTGMWDWSRIVPVEARPRYAKYHLLIAAYPFDAPAGQAQPMDPQSIALRSNPPASRRPSVPAPWSTPWAWQHTGHGHLPGYEKDLDLQVHSLTEAELRARYGKSAPPMQPPPAGDLMAADIAGHALAIKGLVSL